MLGHEVPPKLSAEEEGCCCRPSRWSGRWGEVRRGGQKLAVGENAAAQRPHPRQMWRRLRLGVLRCLATGLLGDARRWAKGHNLRG